MSVTTANAKLVTIIAPYELEEHLARDLRALSAAGYTSVRVNGCGVHGPRKYGILDAANIRFDVITSHERAEKILEHLALKFADQALTVYAMSVEAIPHAHFDSAGHEADAQSLG